MRSPADLLRLAGRSLAALLLGLALVGPQPALASGGSVWSDCTDNGTIDAAHSQADYTDALKNPPADGAEYTDCLSVIRQAQVRQSQGGGSGGSGGGAGGSGSSGGTGGGASTVAPEALGQALKKSGVDPAQPAGDAVAPAAPAPVTVDGEQIDLASGRVPSIASALSLPLPLAASAIVVLLSAGLPLVRYAVARFGGPPTGTTSAP